MEESKDIQWIILFERGKVQKISTLNLVAQPNDKDFGLSHKTVNFQLQKVLEE